MLWRDGYVIVRRVPARMKTEPKRRGKIQRAAGWTLHRATCVYVTRVKSAGTKQPAPIEPYSGTVACTVCKPELIAPEGGH